MTDRRPPRPSIAALASRSSSLLLAVALFATSMLVARTFATPGTGGPSTGGPGPSTPGGGPPVGGPPTGYEGPPLEGIFVNCSPACDLVAVSPGVGLRLTFTDRAVDESEPSLSADGEEVAFRCGEPAVEPGGAESPSPAGLGSICLVTNDVSLAEGATPPPVTTLLSTAGVDYGSPAWSPDGATLAFDFRNADGDVGIGIWEIASGRPTTVTEPGLEASDPAWSPDGATLAFRCGSAPTPSGGEAVRFCIMPKDGGVVTALGAVDGDCGAPTYAPDAIHLAVVCVVPGAERGDLFFLALSEPMSHSITGDELIAPEGEKQVAFSPDGRFVFVRRDDALWAFEPMTEAWSVPPLPPLHGGFDVRVME